MNSSARRYPAATRAPAGTTSAPHPLHRTSRPHPPCTANALRSHTRGSMHLLGSDLDLVASAPANTVVWRDRYMLDFGVAT